jgi:DNA-binding PucR family transcriptional regulator
MARVPTGAAGALVEPGEAVDARTVAASPRVEPAPQILTIAGWDGCSTAIVLGALRLAALAADADVCCLVWAGSDRRIRLLDASSAVPAEPDRAAWLELARSARGEWAQASDDVVVVPVRGPDRTVHGAVALRPPGGAIAVAAGRHIAQLLASSGAHTERVTAYEALFEIGTQIQAEEARPDAIFALIVERARELLQTDVAWLAMVDASRARLRMKVAEGTTTPDFLRMEVRVGTGIGGIALKERRPVAVRDSSVYGNGMPRAVHRALDDEGVVSILCAPMLRDDGMLGALYVGTRTPRDFSEEEASLLSALAAQAAVTIENARLYQELSEKNETLEHSFAIHRFLTDASLAGVGLHRIALELARLIQRDVAVRLDSGPGSCSRYPRHPAADAPVPLDREEIGDVTDDARLEITAGDTTLGALFALGEGPMSPLQRKAFEHGATVIALELVKEQAALEVEWRLQGELLEELLRSPGEPSPDLVARAARFGVALDRPHRIAVMQADGDVAPAALLDYVRRTVRHRGGAETLVAQRGDRVLVALSGDSDRTGRELLEDLQERCRRAGVPFACGLSEARTDLGTALREAEGALALALGSTRRDALVTYDDLGPLRFLIDAPDTSEMSALVRDLLGPLAEHDARRNSELLLTLRVYLETGGHHPTTSDGCHIHVSTLKYRLSRIAAILERSLTDPATRFELSLAFEVLDILQMVGAAPFPAPRRH